MLATHWNANELLHQATGHHSVRQWILDSLQSHACDHPDASVAAMSFVDVSHMASVQGSVSDRDLATDLLSHVTTGYGRITLPLSNRSIALVTSLKHHAKSSSATPLPL
jgi:hypothetical protein